MTQALTTIERTKFTDPEAGEAIGVRKTAGASSPHQAPAVTFLELPAPPSTNALFRNRKGGGRVETEAYRDWKGHAGWRLREQRPRSVRGPVLVVFNIERTSEFADVDNRLKATLDLLVRHDVIDDDRHVSGIAVAWAPPANALMRIAIMPAGDLTLDFRLASDGRTGGWSFPAPQSEEEPS
jgi:Holliday junction resolvase RusA-like endonuclease